MKASPWAIPFLCIAVVACGGSGSPSEPASPTPTPTGTPAPANLEGHLRASDGSATLGLVTVTQNGLRYVNYSDKTGYYLVQGLVVGSAQVLAQGRYDSCFDRDFNIQLHAGGNDLDIYVCP